MSARAVIIGVGSALPAKVVPNSELPEHLETSDEWIRERTGITQRHVAGEDESTATLAADAAKAALVDAGIKADAIDAIIVCTSTPDQTMPSTACLVQEALENHHAAAFDMNAACSGFVYGLNISNALIKSGQAKRVLLIGAETMTRIVDWNDRRTCVLFGDGAGAVVLEAQENTDRGILACEMYSDGAFHGLLETDGGISKTGTAGHLSMQGQEVFRHAVDKMGAPVKKLLASVDLSPDDLSYVIPHQANRRIIEAIARKTGLSIDQFIVTLDRHANTSAASIPLAIAQAYQGNRLKNGDILALPSLGAGLTWGCCIIRW